ncbi:MAG: hypothetical protein U0930_03980 [Pirellulales bacterium]
MDAGSVKRPPERLGKRLGNFSGSLSGAEKGSASVIIEHGEQLNRIDQWIWPNKGEISWTEVAERLLASLYAANADLPIPIALDVAVSVRSSLARISRLKPSWQLPSG